MQLNCTVLCGCSIEKLREGVFLQQNRTSLPRISKSELVSLYPAERKTIHRQSEGWQKEESKKEFLKICLINIILNHSVEYESAKNSKYLTAWFNCTCIITFTKGISMPREKAIHCIYLLYHKHDCVNHFLPNFLLWGTVFLADKNCDLQKIQILLSWKKQMYICSPKKMFTQYSTSYWLQAKII